MEKKSKREKKSKEGLEKKKRHLNMTGRNVCDGEKVENKGKQQD